MPDKTDRTVELSTELDGAFLNHETGRSYAYVARFRKTATDLVWSARIRLGDRWVPIRGGRVPDGGSVRDTFAMSELVRDSVLDSLYGNEMDEALAAAEHHRKRGQKRWRLGLALAGCALAGSGVAWLVHHLR